MKSLLVIISVFFAFNAMAQDKRQLDTIPRIALITGGDDNLAGQVAIYEVTNTKWQHIPYTERWDYVIHHICYLTEDKQPIPANWVIWQVK